MMIPIKFLILGFFWLVGVAHAMESLVTAKEEIKFVSGDENNLLALDKVDDFMGVLLRLQAPASPTRQIDLYYFKNIAALKSESQLCIKAEIRIFGPEKEITLKKTRSEIIPSISAGHFCSLVMTDPDPQALIKERHLFVKVLHAKVFGFVFRFAKAATPSEIKDAQNFIEGLR